MQTTLHARTGLVTLWVLGTLMALSTLVILAFAATPAASASWPGKNGDLLAIITPPSGDTPEETLKIMLAKTDGSLLRSISPPVEHTSRNQVFAPDGRSIAFGAYGRVSNPDEYGIFRYRPGDTKRKLIWKPPGGVGLSYQSLSYSPSGTSLLMAYFYSDCDLFPCDPVLDPASGLYLRDLDTKTTKRLALGQGVTPFEAQYLPNGRQMVMASADDPENAEGTGVVSIYIASSDGDGARRIFRSDHSIGGLSVSPDGGRIAFTRTRFTNDQGLSDIFTVKIDGTGLKQITNDHQSFDPVYSPDGRRIAMNKLELVHGSTDMSIWTSRVDGSDSRRLFADHKGEEQLLDWGRAIPFRVVGYKRSKGQLVVRTWGPGTVRLSGPVFAKRKRSARAAGIVKVPVTIKRGARIKAGAKFRLNVRFAPTGALPSTLTRFIRLG